MSNGSALWIPYSKVRMTAGLASQGELLAYQVDRQRLEVACLAFVDSNDVSEESRLLE